MRLHVAFLPSLILPGPQVCAVIDVIRASTTLITLVERGAGPVWIAGDVAVARRAAHGRDEVVLAGEAEGLAPAGFHYGNSPVELSQVQLAGKPVIFVTTNGTTAIKAVERAEAVLVGALRNATAVCRQGWDTAKRLSADLTVVCAGRENNFGIDDAYCAGYLVDRFVQMGPVDLTDGAQAALRLYQSESDVLRLFELSAAGQNVIRLGLGADLAYCAQRDVSTVVPRLGGEIQMLESAENSSSYPGLM